MAVGGWTIVSVAILLLLAGCAGEGTGIRAIPSTSAAPSATLEQGSGDGALEGFVVDDEERPLDRVRVAGVHRTTPTETFEVETDAQGHVLVTGLLAGTYLVQAARLGYHSVPARSIEVVGGETATVRFVLSPMPILEAFHETKSYAVQFTEHVGLILPPPAPYVGIITGYSTRNVTMRFPVDEMTQGQFGGFVVEMEWKPALSQCQGAFRSDVYAPEHPTLDDSPGFNSKYWTDANPLHWDNVPERARSPTHLYIPREGEHVHAILSDARTDLNKGTPVKIDGEWSVQIYNANQYAVGAFGTPVDVSCMYDTKVTTHVTSFFLQTPPPDWSFIPQN